MPVPANMWIYFALLAAFALVLDLVWVVANTKWGLYRSITPVQPLPVIGGLWLIIVAVNALLITATVRYSQKKHTPAQVFGIGAFIGFVSYVTFNATAVSVFDEWKPRVAAADALWGALLYGTASTLAVMIHHPWNDPVKNAG